MLYQKTTQNAIAAVSRLAELYHDPNQRVSSRDIAESRNLPAPIVAKILTELSRGGLIEGSPGPGGGYRLARPPAEISLQDVASLFERDSNTACPYGPGWCGVGEPCPLHRSMDSMRQKIDEYLAGTSFAVFESSKKKDAKRVRGRETTRKR
jgi:Rrf2 family transcriptional regulator, iron-sulfur cluster assembly transcription factor